MWRKARLNLIISEEDAGQALIESEHGFGVLGNDIGGREYQASAWGRYERA